jgi:hypothetical protein
MQSPLTFFFSELENQNGELRRQKQETQHDIQ